VLVGLFSDVHGNGVAFRAMLADLREHDVDHVVCLGDHAQGGPQPVECLELLRELGCPAVMGNSDHFLLTLDPGDEEVTAAQIENAKWSRSQLSDDLLAFHRSFPPTVELDLGGGRTLLAFHATPRSRDEIVGPWIEEEKFRAPFNGLAATVLAGGHTHQQWVRRLGDAYYVNPGSVGLAVDHLQSDDSPRADACAEYALVALDGNSISVDFRRAPFDRDAVVQAIEASGMPHPDAAGRVWRA
jgi:predicted phosphodiesterase